ncbi:MAG: hypothetical protein MUE71_07635, partial [Chitinophagaceae bacterium]|nr:hypothetical protein [Chitinophagaceae bacterium]
MKKCIRIVHSVTALILATVICNGFKAGAQNVGIGTNTPLSNLHIRGGSAAGLLIDNINGIGSSGIEIKSSTTVNQSLFISHNNSNNAGTIAGVSISGLSMIHTGTASTAGLLLGTTNLHPIYFITNATKQMVITPEGRIAIGTNALNPNNNSVLDIQGTNGGLLIPRLTTAQRDAIPSPPNGLMLYNTTTNSPNYFKTGTGWVEVSGGVATPSWSLTGNIGTNANNFIGTLDPAPLLFRVNGFNAGAIHAAESIGST